MSKEAWAYLTENYFPLVCQINALPLFVAHSYHYENIMIMKHEKQYDVMKKNNFLVGLHLGPIPGSRISKQHRVCLPRAEGNSRFSAIERHLTSIYVSY